MDRTIPLLIYGAGSQARVLADFASDLNCQCVAIVNDGPAPPGFNMDIPVIEANHLEEWLDRTPFDNLHYAVAIGNKYGKERYDRHKRLESLGLAPASLIHTSAIISSSARVGRASQILMGAIIGTAAEIGEAVIVNTGAQVDHECLIEHGVHIGPGAVLSGKVSVGAMTFIGAGCTILPHVSICPGCTVGAGSIVTNSIDISGTYIGQPARRKLSDGSQSVIAPR